MAPMEAGMGMSCWIWLVLVMMEPIEDKVSFSDHQTPAGITYGVHTERVFVHLEYLAPARGGKGVMRVRSIPATLGRLPTFYGASES